MEFKYTAEEIGSQDSLVLVILGQDGFVEQEVKIIKKTQKKVFFDEFYLVNSSDFKNQLFYEQVGGKLESYLRFNAGVGHVHLSHRILVLKRDVQKAKEFMKHKAIKQLTVNIGELMEQLKTINSTEV